MLETQKYLFSLPDDVHYLNCATMSPSLKSVEAAGIKGILRKSQPFTITQDDFFDTIEVVKMAFAQLINCPDSQRIAVMGSLSYGMATVAKNVIHKKLLSNRKDIILIGDEFPSAVYAWDELQELGANVKLIAAPDVLENRGKIWNEKLLQSIDNQTILVCLSPTHWSDGTLFDVEIIGEKCRSVGALFVIDGTQHIGAYPFDIQLVKADAVICAAYKWLLGAYNSAVAYFGEWFDEGVPLEQNWAMRKNSNDFKNLIHYQTEYRPKAYRYNMGEMSNFIALPMLAEALHQINIWGVSSIQNYATSLIINHLQDIKNVGFWIEDASFRSNHLFGIRLPKGVELAPIQQALLAQKVYVSYRGDAIRVSLHLWNDSQDIETFLKILLLQRFK